MPLAATKTNPPKQREGEGGPAWGAGVCPWREPGHTELVSLSGLIPSSSCLAQVYLACVFLLGKVREGRGWGSVPRALEKLIRGLLPTSPPALAPSLHPSDFCLLTLSGVRISPAGWSPHPWDLAMGLIWFGVCRGGFELGVDVSV